MKYQKCALKKIFDTQVQPVIPYSAEIWGLHRLSNVERVHTFARKCYLNVPLKVPNKFVYGETGRYPLYVNSAVRCIRYWLRILKLDPARLPKQAYTMLFNMDERGKNCWATSVRNILFSLVSDTFGCSKALGAMELSSQYLSKDLQIHISRNGVHLYCKRICMQNIEISKPFRV